MRIIYIPNDTSVLQERHFNFFWEGQYFILFFNATGLLKNWKKQHFQCSNLTLFIVPFFLSVFFSFFFFFLFFLSVFLFSFSLGATAPSPPQITSLVCFLTFLHIFFMYFSFFIISHRIVSHLFGNSDNSAKFLWIVTVLLWIVALPQTPHYWGITLAFPCLFQFFYNNVYYVYKYVLCIQICIQVCMIAYTSLDHT